VNTDIAIDIKNVHKSFRKGRDHVLKGLNLTIKRGELLYLLGSSGSGKSVLLKHILGLLKPDEGSILVAGKDISTLSGDELATHRLVYGMLFQNAALFDDFTVFENVAFPLHEHSNLSESEIESKVERALGLLGLKPEALSKYPNELSGGMRKRVGMARAIIREPSILLYDEPTTGLDPVTRTTVDDLITELNQKLNLTSVVISHDLPAAILWADRIAFLHSGVIVFDGTPADFKKSDHPIIRGFLESESRVKKVYE